VPPAPPPVSGPDFVEIVAGQMCTPSGPSGFWLGGAPCTVQECHDAVVARAGCSHEFFNHKTDGDGDCGCVQLGSDCRVGYTGV